MRNSSQNAGCMRRWLRSPTGDSHCCHERVLVCTTAAAAACVSPAASRAPRTCSGDGLEAGPFGPLFGWLGICGLGIEPGYAGLDNGLPVVFSDLAAGRIGVPNYGQGAVVFAVRRDRIADDAVATEHAIICDVLGRACELAEGNVIAAGDVFDGELHFLLQPLLPRGAVGMQCASHELNYTRIARKCKNFFEIFLRGHGEPAKPSNDEFRGGCKPSSGTSCSQEKA